MKTGVFPSTLWDIGTVCECLRASDVDEVTELARLNGKCISNWSFKEDMFEAFAGKGEFWTSWIDDHIVGIGGMVPLENKTGIIWFLGTDLADSQWRTMTRHCRKMKNGWTEDGWSLFNVVPINQPKRLAWLRYLGFDIKAEEANDPFKGYVTFSSLPQ